MKLEQLRRFVAVAEDLHFPRTAASLGIPLASLYSSIDKLEAEVGRQLIDREGAKPRLTAAGAQVLVVAKERVAEAPAPARSSDRPTGGKAKASKGKGRAPIVKGQPKPYKKRQGR